MDTYGTLEYAVVTGDTSTMATFNAAVDAQIAAGWTPLTPGPQMTGATSIVQTFSKGQAGSITPAWLIAVATVGAAGLGSFAIAGDVTDQFHAGFKFTVIGSTGNDGTYQVKNGGSTYSAPNTTIPVVQAVASAIADGEIIGYSPY